MQTSFHATGPRPPFRAPNRDALRVDCHRFGGASVLEPSPAPDPSWAGSAGIACLKRGALPIVSSVIPEFVEVCGPVGSPKQVEKMAELEAKMGLARRLGEASPAPEPWTVERAAKERLATEFPKGDPATSPMPEHITAWLMLSTVGGESGAVAVSWAPASRAH